MLSSSRGYYKVICMMQNRVTQLIEFWTYNLHDFLNLMCDIGDLSKWHRTWETKLKKSGNFSIRLCQEKDGPPQNLSWKTFQYLNSIKTECAWAINVLLGEMNINKLYLHTTFNACSMVAEGATEDSIKLVHSLLWGWLSCWLPFSHLSTQICLISMSQYTSSCVISH